MIAKLLAATALLATPVMVMGQDAPQEPPQRIRNVILFGDETCPPAQSPDEVVVCAKGGDSPYRIPKRFRKGPAEGPAAQSWSRRAELIEEVNRAGLPNSCSPIGSGGQTGCSRQFIQQWAQERLERQVKEGREQGPEE